MALYSGIAVLALGLPMVALIRHRPEDYGEVPDGISNNTDSAAPRPQQGLCHKSVCLGAKPCESRLLADFHRPRFVAADRIVDAGSLNPTPDQWLRLYAGAGRLGVCTDDRHTNGRLAAGRYSWRPL